MVGLFADCEGSEPGGRADLTFGGAKDREPTMMTEQKIIKAKVGLLELAKQLGSVSQACRIMGRSETLTIAGVDAAGSIRCRMKRSAGHWPRS